MKRKKGSTGKAEYGKEHGKIEITKNKEKNQGNRK